MSIEFKSLLTRLNASGVRYLIVGQHALAAHGLDRSSQYLHVWISSEPDNAEKTLKVLLDLGAPVENLTIEGLCNTDHIFRMGVPLMRIAILTVILGLDFEETWNDRFETTLADEPISVPSRQHMIAHKKEVGREQDLADIEALNSQP